MKRVLIATTAAAALFAGAATASAADATFYEPPPAPSPAAARAFSWTGPYIGVFGGLSSGDRRFGVGETGEAPIVNFSVSGSGFLGGAQLGYDWQMDNFVIGAVADIAATNHRSRIELDVPAIPFTAQAQSRLSYIGTVRARAGVAWDRALFYGHGGYAFGRTNQNITAGGATLFNGRTNRHGWVIGAGMEYAFTDNISLQTEYSYVHMGRRNVFSGGGIDVNERLNFHTLKAGVNFRF